MAMQMAVTPDAICTGSGARCLQGGHDDRECPAETHQGGDDGGGQNGKLQGGGSRSEIDQALDNGRRRIATFPFRKPHLCDPS